MNFFNKDICTGYSLTKHLKNISDNDDKYKNSGSLISPIIGEATKNLYRNPLIKGMDSAFRESNTVLESILAQPNGDVKSKLESFKSTLQSYFE